MACVWKNPKSPYWIAQFTAPDGTRRNRSTKQTDRRKAQRYADELEKAVGAARNRELTQAQSIKVLGELMKEVGLGDLEVSTIAKSFNGYLSSRESLGKADATVKRYRPIIDSLLKHLGESRASASVRSLTTAELEAWRDYELGLGKSGTTVDYGISVIRAILKSEARRGLIDHNPAEAVERVNDGAETRECFTPEQLRALWDAASDEWRVMLSLGGDYGMRISDAANMTWDQFDLERETFTYLPQKTARNRKNSVTREIDPLLMQAVRALPDGVGKAPLLPSLAGQKSGSHAGLSNQFGGLMKRAGIKVPQGAKKTGKGRRFRKLGFHSLKHSAISRMAEAGIPEDQRRALVGGHSKVVHARYTHTSAAALKEARAKMKPLVG
jgi:integrase